MVTLATILTVTLTILAGYHLVYRRYEVTAVNLIHAAVMVAAARLALRGHWNAAVYTGGVVNFLFSATWLFFAHTRGITLALPFGNDTWFVFQPIYLIMAGVLATAVGPLILINILGAAGTVLFAVTGRQSEQVLQSLIAVIPLVYAVPALLGVVLYHRKTDIASVLRRHNLYLRESHHRMKNQIALLSSIVSLQDDNGDFPSLKEKLIARLDALASVEDQIYRAPDMDRIPLGPFIRQIVRGAGDDPWVTGGTIDYRVDAIPMFVPASYGSRLGVILVELLINAQKHAFIGRDRGFVIFRARKHGGTIRLEYRDNGIGLPENLDPRMTSSLGLTLIREAIHDLKGDISLHSSAEGLVIRMTVPYQRTK